MLQFGSSASQGADRRKERFFLHYRTPRIWRLRPSLAEQYHRHTHYAVRITGDILPATSSPSHPDHVVNCFFGGMTIFIKVCLDKYTDINADSNTKGVIVCSTLSEVEHLLRKRTHYSSNLRNPIVSWRTRVDAHDQLPCCGSFSCNY